ncbi:hypothetical protein [Pseudonocardia zijingensis]|uniref:Uncharacterized protein n=1 Tax=Pseudonocardia zijingensis TaxID=153376 RepID=A0ABN1QHE2_9PSEU
MDEPIDAAHTRPEGATDEHVLASGKFTEALAYLERARGHLYSFHRLIGEADAMLDEVVDNLRAIDKDALADRVSDEIRGRNVIAGRWTFQLVEEFDDGYYTVYRDLERTVRDEIMEGKRHVYEAEMKQSRRTPKQPGHEKTPEDVTGTV